MIWTYLLDFVDNFKFWVSLPVYNFKSNTQEITYISTEKI